MKYVLLNENNVVIAILASPYPGAIDVTNHPQVNEIQEKWIYDSENNTFSEPGLDPSVLVELKTQKESFLRLSLESANFSTVTLSSGSVITLAPSTLMYLGSVSFYVASMNAFPANFQSPIDALTRSNIALETVVDFTNMNNEIMAHLATNIAKLHSVLGYLWSAEVTTQSQIDAISLSMTIPETA